MPPPQQSQFDGESPIRPPPQLLRPTPTDKQVGAYQPQMDAAGAASSAMQGEMDVELAQHTPPPADGINPEASETVEVDAVDIEDAHEDGGFLEISYSREVDREHAGPFDKIKLIETINAHPLTQESNLVVEPSQGIGGTPYGPVQLYMPFERAQYFAATLPTLSYKNPSKQNANEEIDITINFRALKVAEELQNKLSQAGITNDFLDASTVYVELFLAKGRQFKLVHKKHVAQALKKLDLTIIRSSRPPLKSEVEGEMISLGTHYLGDKINITVAGGTGGSITDMMLGGAFPHRLAITIPGKNETPNETFLLQYKLRVGKSATPSLSSLVACLCAKCHLPSKGTPKALKFCECDGSASAEPSGRGKGAGKGAGKGKGRPQKRPIDAQNEARAVLQKSFGAGSRAEEPCGMFAAGKCGRGKSCSFAHDPRKFTTHPTLGKKANELVSACECPQGKCGCWRELAKTIKCEHPKASNGKSCLLFQGGCFYSTNCKSSTTLLMYNRLAIFICLYPAHSSKVIVKRGSTQLLVIPRCRLPGASRRVTWHIEFNSTLGYPGEGPTAAKGMLLITFNANGLRGRRRARLLFMEANRRKVAVLFIQEHNFESKDVSSLKLTAERAGYAACVSPKTDSTSKGGTAIFLNREILDLGSRAIQWQTLCGGRVTAVDIAIGGTTTRLVCVYAPASPVGRGLFINMLRREQVLARGAIVAGDFNCVPDTSKDVRYPTGSNSSYPNQHAGALETLLARYGLGDMYRLHAGRHAREYSRQGSTVFTRLDRIYSASYDSRWAWNVVGTDPNFCRAGWNSDHLAVAARIEPLGKAKHVPPHGKIDTSILSIPHVRRGVESIWNATYLCSPQN